MKQIYIQDTKQNLAQNLKRMADASFECYQSKLKCKVIRTTVQNHPSVGVAGGRLCKGPPGRPRSPGGYYADHPPDGGVGPPDEVVTPVGVMNQGKDNPKNISEQQLKSLTFGQKANIPLNTEYQTNTNFYSQLNFTIMKKQLFILILAVFASVTVAFGQGAVNGSAPRPLACQDDALHPIAGKPYQYYLDAATQSGGNFTWWATKNSSFITTTAGTTTSNISTALQVGAGKDIINATNYGVPGALATTTITWSSDLLAKTQYQSTPGGSPKSPTFVAAYYTPPSGSGFCADNFKVYELDPLNGFTVDILNLNPATKLPDAGTYSYTAEQCVDLVRSATYTTAHEILFDYGVNVLYYEVVAANFTEQWTPTFLLGGLINNQSADIVWSYDKTFGSVTTVTTAATTNQEYSSPVVNVGNTVTNTSTGVSIYVRITIHNNKYETLAVNTVSLGVAGQNKELLWDVDNNSATADCSAVTTKTFEDTQNQLINPRPTVREGTTSTQTTNKKLIAPEAP